MIVLLPAIAAFLSGYLLAPQTVRTLARWRQRVDRRDAEVTVSLAVGGLDAVLVKQACRMSAAGNTARSLRIPSVPPPWANRAIEAAGLSGSLDGRGLVRSRLRACAVFATVGLSVGAVLSTELAALLCAFGLAFGARAHRAALRREARFRSDEMERDLPEMVEVVAMGLRSGMSFDRSLCLYCRHFDGRLARELAAAQRRWEMGLSTRDDALREMAGTYDSKLLARMVDGIVRALRYGSSLAEVLEAFASEARDARRARLEECIAKAPVKMMLPVGTMILPAMLLMVLGPVLLELAQGF